MADSLVVKLLYSLKVCLWGRAPSSFRVNAPTVWFFSKCVLHSAWIRFRLPLIRSDLSLFRPAIGALILFESLLSVVCEAKV